MRRGVYNRDIYPRFKKRVMAEITEDDIRELCEKFSARNAPATALHVRDVIKAVFEFAMLKGLKIPNPHLSRDYGHEGVLLGALTQNSASTLTEEKNIYLKNHCAAVDMFLWA